MDRDVATTSFCNAAVDVQSWYAAARSKDVRPGRVRSYQMLNRRIAVYRDSTGTAHALDARCPHLGADLGQGEVVGDGLRCAFHHWSFGPDGACQSAPGLERTPCRRVRSYATVERWGIVWIFNGPQPLFELPQPPEEERYYIWTLPGQHIRCHPHLVIGNGLDVAHMDALHGLELLGTPRIIEIDRYRLAIESRGRPRSRLMRRLTGCRRREFAATFTTIGGNLAWLTVTEPLRFHVLFSARVSERAGCDTQTVLFVPRGNPLRLLQALACMYMILADDHRILDGLKFTHAFTPADAPLERFARLVNAMEVW